MISPDNAPVTDPARDYPANLLGTAGADVNWIAKFEEELADDIAIEKSILRKELLIVGMIVLLLVIRGLLL